MRNLIDIIIPNRIGDVVLTLPALLCLRQLEERYPQGRSFRLVTHLPLVPFLDALNIFPSRHINLNTRLRSWLNPAERAYFLVTTSKNIGYHARTTYGSTIPGKIVRYDETIPTLTFPETLPYPMNLRDGSGNGTSSHPMLSTSLDSASPSDTTAPRSDRPSTSMKPVYVCTPPLPSCRRASLDTSWLFVWRLAMAMQNGTGTDAGNQSIFSLWRSRCTGKPAYLRFS